MNAWARRGIQAAIFTGGMLALGAGIASANECCPDRPTPPLAGSVVVPLHLCDGVLGPPGGLYELPCIDRAVSAEALPALPPVPGMFVGTGRHDGVVVPFDGSGNAGALEGLDAAALAGLDGSGLPAVGALPDIPEYPDLAGLDALIAGSNYGPGGPLPLHSAPAPQPDCVALPGKDCVASETEPDCVALPGKDCVASETEPACVAAAGVRCVGPPVPDPLAGPALRVVWGGLAAAADRVQPAAGLMPAIEGEPAAGGGPAEAVDPAVAALAELEMLRELVMELGGLVDLPVGLPTA